MSLFSTPSRQVKRVFIHCSASDKPEHDDISVIREWHLARKWVDVGYHYYIKKNGEVQKGRPLSMSPSAQYPHNTGTIAICVGGLLKEKFTEKQFSSLRLLCQEIYKHLPKVTFHGHREVNKHKTCPVFDYKKVLNLNNKGKMIT